jgi:hypothetical protein
MKIEPIEQLSGPTFNWFGNKIALLGMVAYIC